MTISAAIARPPENCRAALAQVLDAFPPTAHKLGLDCSPGLDLSAAQLEPVRDFVREAVGNAIAHAFPPGRQGHVWVKVSTFEGRVSVAVRDDGIGMPDLMDYAAGGRRRMMGCAEALGGSARMASAPFGGGLATLIFRPDPVA